MENSVTTLMKKCAVVRWYTKSPECTQSVTFQKGTKQNKYAHNHYDTNATPGHTLRKTPNNLREIQCKIYGASIYVQKNSL